MTVSNTLPLRKKSIPAPSDQKVRDRFAMELDCNFSVIAPAGVGKTASIVERVIQIATSNENLAVEILPKLVVVTYTNRAADEMQQRARTAILQKNVSNAVLAQFNRAFFGTIHSFCLKLLRTHGYHIGLPPKFDLVQDEDALWFQFVRQLKEVGTCLSESQLQALQRHRSLMDVIALGRKLDTEHHRPVLPDQCPNVNINAVMSHAGRANAQKNIDLWKGKLSAWLNEKLNGKDFLPLPVVDVGGGPFISLCQEAFEPLRAWLNDASWLVGKEVSDEFRKYRLSRGEITYNDQTYFSAELIANPIAGRKIREEGYRIILDEAQDTDPTQFKVLLEVARDPGVKKSWVDSEDKSLRPGHFSMVGDPQQSIYSDRADLQFYQDVRKHLSDCRSAEELIFEVTFRCDRMIVDAVNQIAPSMLHGNGNQVEYVPLQLRPLADEGQICRVTLKNTLEPTANGKPHKDGVLARHEAKQIAEWIKSQGLKNLRASSWSEVAILCPRKAWFAPIASALHDVELSVQVQSPDDIVGEQPAFAWFTALLSIFSEPENAYEIVGVLREIFAISDHELAWFSRGKGSLFQIKAATDKGHGVVAETLNHLNSLYSKILMLSLRDAVKVIIDEINLRDRVMSLPEIDPDEVDSTLDMLMMQATIADDQGGALREFAEKIKNDFWKLNEEKTPHRDSIQLITCQKAKGLQWQAVIIPYTFRDIIHRTEKYPRVLGGNTTGTRTPWIAFNKSDVPEELQENVKELRTQEMQRVLYVALTRARKTLVLVDDEALFQKHSTSFADCMVLQDAASRQVWQKLPVELSPDGSAVETVNPRFDISKAFAVDQTRLDKARSLSQKFNQRTLPHSLAHSSNREESEKKLVDPLEETDGGPLEAAIAYGLWWHSLMESVASRKNDDWGELFTSDLKTCPDRDRAKSEWECFLKSPTFELLKHPDWLLKPEMPFLYKPGENACVEGIMDLVLFNQKTSSCIVLDWKTNRIQKEGFSMLVKNYAPQIDAYTRAIEQITGNTAKGAIYSTATGLCSLD